MKKRALLGTLAAAVVIAGGMFSFFTSANSSTADKHGNFALVEMQVDKLTCGSCVKNISNALAEVAGIGDVDVNLSNGRARVEFLPERTDVVSVASTITKAGYPAKVLQILSQAEYKNFREDENRLASRFVGRIGDQLISREKFAQMVAELEGATRPGSGNILKSAWENILQRELLLEAANRNGVVVQDGEVDLEVQKIIGSGKLSDSQIEDRFGGREEFHLWLKEKMVIERNITQNVVQDEKDALRRRTLLNRWYGDLVGRTPVAIFDPALKSIVAGSGKGCGGSCCG